MDNTITSTSNDENKIWEVSLNGEIDIYNSNKVKEYLSNLLEENKYNIEIDCSNLNYIDSTGLSSLISTLKKVKTFNGNISLLNLNSNISRIFTITNLNKIFDIKEAE